ncbi:hypothetical protein [Synechocystis sp. CACIAM 05]|uniref:hypothetical protein n=1 Tax=Synechocystis sp. CACIAM 05 TaxID=1933929 RepID=UPI001390EE12|nr:hypothetical protein [Synechocystis sp. CACIAM 05]
MIAIQKNFDGPSLHQGKVRKNAGAGGRLHSSPKITQTLWRSVLALGHCPYALQIAEQK